MTPTAVAERAKHVAAVRADTAADATAIECALVASRQIRAWNDAQEAGLIKQLSSVMPFPEPAIAAAGKCSIGQAHKSKERSDTLAAAPRLGEALSDGEITAGHIDALTRGAKQLDDEQRDQLFDRVEALTGVAAAATVDEFGRRLRLEIKRIQADDGMARFERQQASVRLNTWTDDEGMWNLRGRFDPLTGVRLAAKIDHTINALFAEATPDRCPTDPVEKQKFLAAHSLARLIEGAAGSTRPGRAEFVVVIDADARDQAGPVAEWAIPVEVPARMLAELANDPSADVHAVVVRNGVVIHAPGEVNLGRATRLANRAQRRALRALYATCALPDCGVRYDRCKLHHVRWWRHGGRTDLDNLLPVCARHHANIHNDDWMVTLGPRRELSLRLPDGSIRNTGPPHRAAA